MEPRSGLMEKLQKDPDLMHFRKGNYAIHQWEAVHEQVQILKLPTDRGQDSGRYSSQANAQYILNTLHGIKPHINNLQHQRNAHTIYGREPHNHQQCPAKDATCHRCSNKSSISTKARTTSW